MAMLEVKNLKVSYGLIQAIKDVSFAVEEGQIVTLIGANGAGKTTVMHAISGLIPKQGGSITYDGRDITTTAPHKLISMGIAHVPEGRRVFQELTVEENLRLGAYTRRDKKEISATLEQMYQRFPVLKQRSRQIAGTLSGGEQQMLAMSRAMMSHPRLLLLDEPSMGLSPLYVGTIFDMIRQVNEEGTTVLLVEQNAKKALAIADQAYVLEIGNIIQSGPGTQLLGDDSIRKAYLGG